MFSHNSFLSVLNSSKFCLLWHSPFTLTVQKSIYSDSSKVHLLWQFKSPLALTVQKSIYSDSSKVHLLRQFKSPFTLTVQGQSFYSDSSETGHFTLTLQRQAIALQFRDTLSTLTVYSLWQFTSLFSLVVQRVYLHCQYVFASLFGPKRPIFCLISRGFPKNLKNIRSQLHRCPS